MRIPITEKQFSEIQRLGSRRAAIANTLHTVLDRAERETEEINDLSNKVWDEIILENQLSDAIDWEIKEEDGKPYVVSIEKG